MPVKRRHSKGRRGPTLSSGASYLHEVIGEQQLRKWVALCEQPLELLISVASKLPELTMFFNRDRISCENMAMVLTSLQALVLMKQCCKTNIFKALLEVLVHTQFYPVHVVSYLKMCPQEKCSMIVDIILRLVCETGKVLPSKLQRCSYSVLFIMCCRVTKLCECRDMLSRVVTLYKSKFLTVRKDRSQQQSRWKTYGEPPDDIRDLSVYPSVEDLHADVEPFLRPNRVGDVYEGKTHYLDVIFRLMRENFMEPLRNVLETYRAAGCNKKDDSTALFYDNVRIIGVNINGGIEHIVLLDVTKLKSTHCDMDNRLIFGSFLSFSTDNFNNSIICATVSQLDRDELKKGVLRVKIQTCLSDVFMFSSEQRLTMIENSCFFEVYQHVLEGLQEMVDKLLPMEEYIVRCQTNVDNPAYLSHQVASSYNLSTLSKLCVNEEQKQAVTSALINKLALIQGAPATGKTFVGLKIVHMLLNNTERQLKMEQDPILMICFTNHTLDRFLEGVLEFCSEGVVRVGGKSDSQILQKFNLRDLRLEKKNGKSLTARLGKIIYQIINTEQKIKKIWITLQKVQEVIQTKSVLKDFISDSQYKSLSVDSSDPLKGDIPCWLSTTGKHLEHALHDSVRAHLMSLIIGDSLITEKPYQLLGSDSSAVAVRLSIIARSKLVRYWISELRQTVPTHLTCFPHDSVLQPFIDPSLFSFIKGQSEYCGEYGLKAWVVGNSCTSEMIDAIKAMRTNNSDRADTWLDDRKTHQREHDLRVFCDEGEDAEIPEAAKPHISKEVPCKPDIADLLQRARVLGVDLSMDMADSQDGKGTPSKTFIPLGSVIQKLRECVPMSARKVRQVVNVWQLSASERIQLYKYWITSYLSRLKSDLIDLIDRYEILLTQKHELLEMRDISILKSAKVIGMTTTGAAKYRKMLQAVGPQIVVVEEAAMVLEAHIITALSEQCQHLILIGDNQYLRPQTQALSLASEFSLDTSLFERLINNKVKYVELTHQWSMRPEISVYMRHIYPTLTDSASVNGELHIRGMNADVFFIMHNHTEHEVNKSMIGPNMFEAKYMTALCEYLILQGYSTKDITILGTFDRQVMLIKECVTHKPMVKDVTVSTVEHYRGERNKIILLSLVSSNHFGSVDFLGTSSYVCMALSRAKYGLYVIGDLNLLASRCTLWARILETAATRGCTGDVLPLKCRSHSRITNISHHADFGQPVLGGCGKPCYGMLRCGHLCSRPCHPSNHTNVKCEQLCKKICSLGHTCRAMCCEKCPPCNVLVRYKLKCGHTLEAQCHRPQLSLKCNEPCAVTCRRGHKCESICSQPCSPCQALVTFRLPCGHKRELVCSETKLNDNFLCARHCEEVCVRGHRCRAMCYEKCPPCNVLVRYTLKCGHTLVAQCHRPQTSLKCNEPCAVTCPRGHKCLAKCDDHKIVSANRKILNEVDHLQLYGCQAQYEEMCVRGHHKYVRQCSIPSPPCLVYAMRKLPCGHEKLLACYSEVKFVKCEVLSCTLLRFFQKESMMLMLMVIYLPLFIYYFFRG